MEITILTLFPNYFKGPFESSMIKRARDKQLLDIQIYDIRNFSSEKRKRVDDKSFGGGTGMVMMAPPLVAALRHVKKSDSHVILLSPQGKILTAHRARELSKIKHLVFICGHYEGPDERVRDYVDEELSIGDYVLTNGGPAAIVCVDAIARFLPGFFEKKEAVEIDSFEEGIFDYPHYTQPVEFEGKRVPQVLLEGDHKKIAKWRASEALKKTAKKRPDLYFVHLSHEGRLSDHVNNENLSVTLLVKDLAKSVAFYRKVLRLKLVDEKDRSATFAVGKSFLALKEGDEEMRESKRVIFTIEVAEIPVFHQTLSRLKKAGRVVGQIEKKIIENDMSTEVLHGTTSSRVAFTDVDDHPWVLCLTDMNLMISN